MMVLRPHPEGAVLPVQSRPGAKRNEVCGVQAGRLKVLPSVAAPSSVTICIPVNYFADFIAFLNYGDV